MRALPRPAFDSKSALDLCIGSVRDPDLKRRLGLAAETIEKAEATYLVKGDAACLFEIAGTKGVGGDVSTAEMETLYARTFVRSARTRHIYDTIKKLPENDICPLCGQRTVYTLDHYLPQSDHPALTITSINLVPACGECNHVKRAKQADKAEDQTLHPYFDHVDDARWLFARVEERAPAALYFYAAPPDHWLDVKRARVKRHFEMFGLGALYASHSAVELNNMRFGLRALAAAGGPEVVSAHLMGCAESCAAAQANSWQRATYDALAKSKWFYSGGFD